MKKCMFWLCGLFVMVYSPTLGAAPKVDAKSSVNDDEDLYEVEEPLTTPLVQSLVVPTSNDEIDARDAYQGSGKARLDEIFFEARTRSSGLLIADLDEISLPRLRQEFLRSHEILRDRTTLYDENEVPIQTEEQKRLNAELVHASKMGDTSRVRELLTKGALLGEPDRFGTTPFEWAAVNGHIECLNVFLDELENNIPVDRLIKYYACLIGVRKKRHSILPLFQRDVRSLCSLTDCIYTLKKTQTASMLINTLLKQIISRLEMQVSLNVALSLSSDEMLRKALISAGAIEPNDLQAFLHKEAQQRTFEDQTPLVVPGNRNYYNNPLLKHSDFLVFFATKHENEELLEALINAQASVNAVGIVTGLSPLHMAVSNRNARLVSRLLKAGAQSYTDKSGETPFHLACKAKLFAIGQLLLEAGFPITQAKVYENPYVYHPMISRGFWQLRMPHDFFSDRTYKESYFKMLLQASPQRYATTKSDAKAALKNIGQLFYIFGVRLGLPPYVIYDIVLYAMAPKPKISEATFKNMILLSLNRVIEREDNAWGKNLRADFETILYRCTSIDLQALWREVVNESVPELFREKLLSKLHHYMFPFTGGEDQIIWFMEKASAEAYNYREVLFGSDHALYYRHLENYLKNQ